MKVFSLSFLVLVLASCAQFSQTTRVGDAVEEKVCSDFFCHTVFVKVTGAGHEACFTRSRGASTPIPCAIFEAARKKKKSNDNIPQGGPK